MRKLGDSGSISSSTDIKGVTVTVAEVRGDLAPDGRHGVTLTIARKDDPDDLTTVHLTRPHMRWLLRELEKAQRGDQTWPTPLNPLAVEEVPSGN